MSHTNLWAPWRLAYLRDMVEREEAGQPALTGCFLCDAAGVDPQQDEAGARDRLVLLNDERGVVLLNRYPYTNGHLLVAPREHLGTLSALSSAQRAGLMELTALCEQLLGEAINPQGFNVGINVGRAAGAGLPGHLHVHVVPRWAGDTNFMQTVGAVRVIPDALEASYAQLREVLGGLE